MKKLFRLYLLVFMGFLLPACNLSRDITVPLPPYSPVVVVECYLESGMPLRALVTRSNSFFDTALIPKPAGKSVNIFINDQSYRLEPNLTVDTTFSASPKIFNYSLAVAPKIRPGDVCRLEVEDDLGGGLITAQAVALPPVKIDSIGYKFTNPEDTLAYLATYIRDTASQKNYYRVFIIARDKTGDDQKIDFAISDNSVNGQRFPIVTRPRYFEGQSVQVWLYHVSPEYFDFINTVESANDFTGGNPFFQPAVIKSNIKGGTGIFTVLSYDSRTVVPRR